MAVQSRQLYRSSNGDRWHLARDGETGRVFVRHEPNQPSGGQASDIGLADFLAAGEGPEQQKLLNLIATLVGGPRNA